MHNLTVRSLPGDVLVATCSCGAWHQSQMHPAYWGFDPGAGHRVHVHLAELTSGRQREHMKALDDVFAKTEAALKRMLDAGAVPD